MNRGAEHVDVTMLLPKRLDTDVVAVNVEATKVEKNTMLLFRFEAWKVEVVRITEDKVEKDTVDARIVDAISVLPVRVVKEVDREVQLLMTILEKDKVLVYIVDVIRVDTTAVVPVTVE